MRYFGGKARLAKQLAPMLTRPGRAYVEPFVGGANVLCAVSNGPPRVASDANAALIHMWRAVAQGWEPPAVVTKEDYDRAKALPDENPVKAFMGFGCSFAGKWFGGFASCNRGDNYAAQARNSILKKREGLRGAALSLGDYRRALYPENAIVYCDPPYRGTTGYGAVGAFDSAAFWKFYEGLSRAGRLVVVSEYAAPDDWPCVWELRVRTEIRGKGGQLPRVEKLFVHKSQLGAFLNV